MFVLVLFVFLFAVLLILLLGTVNYMIQKWLAEKLEYDMSMGEHLENIGGLITNVLVKGDGEPLIFVHGSQMNIYDWRNNIDFFASKYRVYAFDMVGCGLTDKPLDASYSPDYFSGFIESFMDHYAIEKAAFVASSWGGGHVFHFALKHPERVDKLIMSSPCGLKHEMMLLDRLLAIPVAGNIVMLFGNKLVVRQQLLQMFHDKRLVTEKLINRVFGPLYMKGGINATLKSYRNADFSFVQNNLEEIKAPVLIFWGKEDEVHPLWMLEEMKRRLPDCSARLIGAAGHLLHEECSSEFNNEALKFLTRLSA